MISVIVPVYNSESLLDICMESIVSQTYRDFEVLVVDDGSTDKSSDIIKKWSKIDKRIVLITQNNEGASSARNLGLDIAKGEWVAFVDSDDSVTPDYLRNLYDLISKNENIVIGVSSHSVYYDGKFSHDQKFGNSCYQIHDYKSIFQVNKLHKYGFPWGKIYRKEIIDENHLRFDKDICIAEDLIFLMQYFMCTISLDNAHIGFSDECDYKYQIRKGSLSTSSSSFEREYYSYEQYRIMTSSLIKTYNMDIATSEFLYAPIAYYVDRCLNAIFQKPLSPDWKDKLSLLDRELYKKYKHSNTTYEFLLKFLFIHKFWKILSQLR